jgi:hypothetical protein
MTAPRIRVKASQQAGYSRDSQTARRGIAPRPEDQPAHHREQRHHRVHELVAQLVDAVKVEETGQRDVVDHAGDGDRDQADQPERPEQQSWPVQPERQQQHGAADEQVGWMVKNANVLNARSTPELNRPGVCTAE